MTDLSIPKLTKAEIDKRIEAWFTFGNAMRWILLDLFEDKAYITLGYKDWETFCAERLGLHYNKTHHSDLLRAARVERNIFGSPQSSDISELASTNPSTISREKLPIKTALQLAKLDDPEQQKKAYEQIQTLRDYGYRTPKDVENGLRNIIKQMLNGNSAALIGNAEPLAPPPAIAPAEESAPPEDGFNEKIQSAPRKPKTDKPAVSTFTPPADPEPLEDAKPFDFEDAIDVLNTITTWIQNQEIDGPTEVRIWVAAGLCEIAEWVEHA